MFKMSAKFPVPSLYGALLKDKFPKMGSCFTTQLKEADVTEFKLSDAVKSYKINERGTISLLKNDSESRWDIDPELHYKINAVTGRPPNALRAHSLVLHDINLYLFGGVSNPLDMVAEAKPADILSNETVKFRIASQKWEPMCTKGIVPPARSAHSAVVYEGAMYVLGTDLYDSADLFQLDLQSLHWRCVPATGDTPPAMAGHSSVVFGDTMLVFGGEVNLHITNSLYMYRFKSYKWTNRVPKRNAAEFEPQCRRDHTAVMFQSSMIVFGGFGRVDPVEETCVRFEPSTRNWHSVKQVGECPRARGGHIAQIYEDCMIIHGGMGCGGAVYSDTFMLHIRSGTWRKLGLGPKLCFHAAAIFDERFYIFGGNNGLNNSNDMYILPLRGPVAETKATTMSDTEKSEVPDLLKLPRSLELTKENVSNETDKALRDSSAEEKRFFQVVKEEGASPAKTAADKDNAEEKAAALIVQPAEENTTEESSTEGNAAALERAAEEKRIAEEKAAALAKVAEDKRIAEEKAAAPAKVAEEKRIAEEKAAALAKAAKEEDQRIAEAVRLKSAAKKKAMEDKLIVQENKVQSPRNAPAQKLEATLAEQDDGFGEFGFQGEGQVDQKSILEAINEAGGDTLHNDNGRETLNTVSGNNNGLLALDGIASKPTKTKADNDDDDGFGNFNEGQDNSGDFGGAFGEVFGEEI